MINLYTADYCPYCHKVIDFMNAHNITFENKDIKDEANRKVVEDAGQMQVPYMLDTDTGLGMYESGDIIEYIKQKYKSV